MKIQMVDTVGQYKHIQQEVDAAILDVVRSGAFINGPAVHRFKDSLAAYMDVPQVIPAANGTDALQVAFMALGLKPGDEVITPSFTYVATVEVISLLGLVPVFVEVDARNFNAVPAAIEEAITEKTKAILPVHLYGQVAPMEPIMEIAKKYGLPVVEDTAQAIGAEYRFSDGRVMKAGTIGDIGTTSFYPSKNLGAYGDGGAIFTRNQELADKLLMICNHGSNRRYYHETIGVNSRLDSIQAALLDIKLRHLDEYNQARITAADRYDEILGQVPGILLPYREEYQKHVFHQYTIRLTGGRELRDGLQQYLADQGIPSMIYYPLSIHQQPAYRHYGFQDGTLPVTEMLTAEVLSLPMHTELSEEHIQHITSNVIQGIEHITQSLNINQERV